MDWGKGGPYGRATGENNAGMCHLFSLFIFFLFSLVLGTAGWLVWGVGVGGFVFGFILNTSPKFIA